jgi:lysozyme family protein
MTAANFDAALEFTLLQEGGFSDDPNDPGGPTMDGITLSEFQTWFGADKTVDDLKAITRDQASTIYQASYWEKVNGEELPSGVDLSMFDMAVNAGPTRSIQILQKELNVAVDGILGPITLKVLLRNQPTAVISWLDTGQTRFYRSLSTFQYFGRGWLNRTEARYHAAMMLAIPIGPHGKAFM